MNQRKRVSQLLILLVLFLITLSSVYAHATPITYDPKPQATLDKLPDHISISFSERIEAKASIIEVIAPSGEHINTDLGYVIPDDEYTFFTQLEDNFESGTYQVYWKLVSADDGHFTKGEYVFFVNEENKYVAQTGLQIQHLTSIPETILIWLELTGIALLLGIIVLFSFIFKENMHYEKRFKKVFFFAILISVFAITVHIVLKTFDLQQLRVMGFLPTLKLFLSTTSGTFAIYKLMFLALLVVTFFLTNYFLKDMKGLLLLLVTAMIVFARARITHAAADSFALVSIFVMFIHLFAKLLWGGLLFCILYFCYKQWNTTIVVNNHVSILIHRLLSILIGLSSVSGLYIVWIHLERFPNLLISEWGNYLVFFSLIAVVILLLRVYQHLTFREKSWQWILLALEAALYLVLLYASSHLGLTSPPAEQITNSWFTLAILVNAIVFIVISYLLNKFDYDYRTYTKEKAQQLQRITWGQTVLKVILIMTLFIIIFNFAVKTDFERLCERNDHFWLQSVEMFNGKISSTETKTGCTLDVGLYHFADLQMYEKFMQYQDSTVKIHSEDTIIPGVATNMTLQILDDNDNPITGLTIEHDRIVHVIIISQDLEEFMHIHSEDLGRITDEMKKNAEFPFEVTFPKAGGYTILVDYVVGPHAQAKQFFMTVGDLQTLPLPDTSFADVYTKQFGEYEITIEPLEKLRPEKEAKIKFHISKNGIPVENLEPYLAATMHVALIKTDLRKFDHTHGEIFLPGSQYLEMILGDYINYHSHFVPESFGPDITARLTFPETGYYKLFAEFKHEGNVVLTDFMVEVDRKK